MVDALILLTSITVVLVAALIATIVSQKLKIPSQLLLFLLGVLLFYSSYAGQPIVQLGTDLLSSISIVALILIIFEATSRIKFLKSDSITKDATAFFIVSLVLNTVLLSYVGHALELEWFAAIMLALLMSCVEFSVIFQRHHIPKNKVTQFLHDESNISCAFVLVIPFLIISFLQASPVSLLSNVVSFSISLFAGVGAGVLIGLIMFKMLHFKKFERFALIITSVAALVAYTLAQRIDGNGVVAVATLGLIFGNVFIKQKQMINAQVHNAYTALEALLFTIVGATIGIPLTLEFLIVSLSFFVFYLVFRFAAVQFLFKEFDFYQRTEIALFAPKGLATIAIAFALLNYTFAGSGLIVQYLSAVFVYSLIFDTILAKSGVYKHR